MLPCGYANNKTALAMNKTVPVPRKYWRQGLDLGPANLEVHVVVSFSVSGMRDGLTSMLPLTFLALPLHCSVKQPYIPWHPSLVASFIHKNIELKQQYFHLCLEFSYVRMICAFIVN